MHNYEVEIEWVRLGEMGRQKMTLRDRFQPIFNSTGMSRGDPRTPVGWPKPKTARIWNSLM